MIGSEGTLGVITEITLKLQKIPQYSVVYMFTQLSNHFSNTQDAKALLLFSFNFVRRAIALHLCRLNLILCKTKKRCEVQCHFYFFVLPQVAMCNFPTVKDAADVAIATMMSGIQVRCS